MSMGLCDLEGNQVLDVVTITTDWVAYGYRLDTKKIDHAALKCAVKTACENFCKEHLAKKCPKNIKFELQSSIRDQMILAARPSTKLFVVCVNLTTGMVVTDAPFNLNFPVPLLPVFNPVAEEIFPQERLQHLKLDQTINHMSYGAFLRRLLENIVNGLDSELDAENKLYLGSKVAFFSSENSPASKVALVGDNLTESKEFQSIDSKLPSKLEVQCIEPSGNSPWSVLLDTSEKIVVKLPKPDKDLNIDDVLAQRIEVISNIFDELDYQYFRMGHAYATGAPRAEDTKVEFIIDNQVAASCTMQELMDL
jgi:hypothetical protein